MVYLYLILFRVISRPSGVVRLEQKNDTFLEMGIYDDGPFEAGDENEKNPDLVPAPANSYLGESPVARLIHSLPVLHHHFSRKEAHPSTSLALTCLLLWSSRVLTGLGEGFDKEGPAHGGGGGSPSEPQWGGGAPEERRGNKQHPGRGVHPGRGRPGLLLRLRSGCAGSQWRRVSEAG